MPCRPWPTRRPDGLRMPGSQLRAWASHLMTVWCSTAASRASGAVARGGRPGQRTRLRPSRGLRPAGAVRLATTACVATAVRPRLVRLCRLDVGRRRRPQHPVRRNRGRPPPAWAGQPAAARSDGRRPAPRGHGQGDTAGKPGRAVGLPAPRLSPRGDAAGGMTPGRQQVGLARLHRQAGYRNASATDKMETAKQE